MINSKKMVTLCATALTGLATLGSIAPISAFADTAHSGQTTIEYTMPQPAEWGLSVPSELAIDKVGNVQNETGAYGIGETSIVNSDGSEHSDVNGNQLIYEINGTASNNKLGSKELYIKIGNQGEEITDWNDTNGQSLEHASNKTNIQLAGNQPLKSQFMMGVKDKDTGSVTSGDSMTISWTAIRNQIN